MNVVTCSFEGAHTFLPVLPELPPALKLLCFFFFFFLALAPQIAYSSIPNFW